MLTETLTNILPLAAGALAGALLALVLIIRPAAKALRLWVIAS